MRVADMWGRGEKHARNDTEGGEMTWRGQREKEGNAAHSPWGRSPVFAGITFHLILLRYCVSFCSDWV